MHALATEVRAFRDNVRLERDAPPARAGICASCHSFEWLKSPIANIAPVYQAFPEGVGVCCRGRPTMTQRASPGGPIIVPVFIEMHPEQRCDEWSPLHDAADPPA